MCWQEKLTPDVEADASDTKTALSLVASIARRLAEDRSAAHALLALLRTIRPRVRLGSGSAGRK